MPVLTANSSLLTYSSKLYEVLQYYFAPSSTAEEYVDVPNSLYAFIGRITPWPDPFNPPAPEQSQIAIKETFKNIIAAKKIISSDISPSNDFRKRYFIIFPLPFASSLYRVGVCNPNSTKVLSKNGVLNSTVPPYIIALFVLIKLLLCNSLNN